MLMQGSHPAKISEEAGALLQRAQAGDPDAYCELVREEESRLFRQALLVCGDAALAEDLAQDTLFTGWRRISQFDSRCRLFTWLCGILLNLARNSARRKTPTPVSLLSEDSRREADQWLQSIVDAGESPDERLQRFERAEIVQNCLKRLPDIHREVIYLRFFVDDSLEGIAAALNCSVGTIKSRLFNALEKLDAMAEMNRIVQSKDVV
jgi:RNA polymerase sigma-70 factor (ECF subfamily)